MIYFRENSNVTGKQHFKQCLNQVYEFALRVNINVLSIYCKKYITLSVDVASPNQGPLSTQLCLNTDSIQTASGYDLDSTFIIFKVINSNVHW